MQPSSSPSRIPTGQPSLQPSIIPTSFPTSIPSGQPTQPTSVPSSEPSQQPSTQPSTYPSFSPTGIPTTTPSRQPSRQPSSQPTTTPTSSPSCGVGYTGDFGTACRPCKPGYYLSNITFEACLPCEMNTYQDQSGQGSCHRCYYPRVTATDGATWCDSAHLGFDHDQANTAYVGLLGMFIILHMGYLIYLSQRNTSLKEMSTVFMYSAYSVLQSVNYLADMYFFFTQRIYYPLFVMISICLSLKATIAFIALMNRIKQRNYYAENHPLTYFVNYHRIFWLRCNKNLQPYNLTNGTVWGGDAEGEFFMTIGFWFFAVCLQLGSLIVFLIWMALTAILWAPFMVIGVLMLESKLLCFWSFLRWWARLWTGLSPHIGRDENDDTSSISAITNQHLHVKLWKYSLVSDGILESLPMFVFKVVHIAEAVHSLESTNNEYAMHIVNASIGCSALTFFMALALIIQSIAEEYFMSSKKRLQRDAKDILEFMQGIDRFAVSSPVNKVSEETALNEVNVKLDELKESSLQAISKPPSIVFNKIDIVQKLKERREKFHTEVLPSAEQQLIFLLINYTQESLVAASQLHKCSITHPGRICYASPKALSKIIFDVKLHPIRISIDGKQTLEIAVPVDQDVMDIDKNRNIKYKFAQEMDDVQHFPVNISDNKLKKKIIRGKRKRELNKKLFLERCTNRFRQELFRIANCVTIEKSFLYRLPRYVQKRFTIIVKVVNDDLKMQKERHNQEQRFNGANIRSVFMQLWFVFSPFLILLQAVSIYVCILIYKAGAVLGCYNDQLQNSEDSVMFCCFIDLRHYYTHTDDTSEVNISDEILHADNPNIVALQAYCYRRQYPTRDVNSHANSLNQLTQTDAAI
jgi:hypothetical protein